MRRDEMEAGSVCYGAVAALFAAGFGAAALQGRDLRLSLRGAGGRTLGKLLLVDQGVLHFSQAGRCGSLGQGQFTVLDGRLPVEIEAEGAYAHSLALLQASPSPAQRGRICGEQHSHRPVASFVQRWAAGPVLPSRSQWHLSAALAQMLGALDEDAAAPNAQAVLRTRALALIESQLAEITPLGLAEQLRVSRRHLDAVFAAAGETVAGRIWSGRVARAAERLRWPGELSITVLAHELGFKDSSHFSRLFRRHKGLSPTQWRRDAGMVR